MGVERRRYRFQGRVQGVGFRATAHRLARSLPVSGHVLNLSDGGVELVAEGDPRDLDGLILRLRQELGSRIQQATFVTEPPLGAACASGFQIRY